MAALTSYEAMTGRSLPTGVTSVVQDQPGTYVTGGATGYTPYVPKTTTRRIPKYDNAGKLIGYTVETVDEDGKVLSSVFESATPGELNKSSQIDAVAAITALLASYGIGDLGTSIVDAVQKGYSAETINLMMQDPNGTDPLATAFQKRFSANKIRAAAGKAVLSPAEYLAAEKSYSQVMQSYGVSSLATRDKLSSFIANDISASEVADRVGLAINRVQNADPETKKMLATYYPSLNQADIVGAVLDPAEGLPALQRKVQIAEIGGAALTQGLNTTLAAQTALKTGYEGLTTGAMGAEEIANLGLTTAQVKQAYQGVAEVTPRAEFLSSISQGEDYTRLQAEQEAFQGLASARRARMSLTEQEKARFGGSSGISKTGLTSQKSGLV